jgi:hypothetical protein
MFRGNLPTPKMEGLACARVAEIRAVGVRGRSRSCHQTAIEKPDVVALANHDLVQRPVAVQEIAWLRTASVRVLSRWAEPQRSGMIPAASQRRRA